MGFGSSLQGVIGDADAVAQQAWGRNQGDDIDAFKEITGLIIDFLIDQAVGALLG
ncbi:MAG TPA: hypothetical protein VGP70_13970 [Actinomadura sp.]|jgi:hypothetical protein|nr:hypothetical protein [Actinomadura sp.]